MILFFKSKFLTDLNKNKNKFYNTTLKLQKPSFKTNHIVLNNLLFQPENKLTPAFLEPLSVTINNWRTSPFKVILI